MIYFNFNFKLATSNRIYNIQSKAQTPSGKKYNY